MPSAIHWLMLLTISALIAAARSPQPATATIVPSPITPGIRVVLQDLSGAERSVDIVALDADAFELADGTRVQRRQLLRADFANGSTGASELVLLTNGDQLGLHVESITDDVVRGSRSASAGTPVEIPLELVRCVVRGLPEVPSRREQLLRAAAAPAENRDFVRLSNGDQIDGEFLGLVNGAVRIRTAAGEQPVPLDAVVVLRFNDDLLSEPDDTNARAIVGLGDESRIEATEVSLADGVFRIRATWGASLEVNVGGVESLQFLGGRIEYLSDLPVSSFDHTPFLDGKRELQRDRNVNRGPLVLAGRRYDKGLGMTSRSVAVWDLGARYESFTAVVGIDEGTGGGGSVEFAVEVDGKRVFSSGPLTGSAAPQRVGPVSLSGALKLRLVVDYATRGDILDRANWCDAVLVR